MTNVEKTRITGIILAGGESKRMGVDKSLVDFRGRKLIDYPILLLESFCAEILISTNSPNLSAYPYPQIPDENGRFGPLSGIYSCLKESHHDINIVLSCDMPYLSHELIRRLIENFGDADLIMPRHGAYFEPLCAIYRKSLLEPIASLFRDQSYSPLSLIPLVNFKEYVIEDNQEEFGSMLFWNINTQDDLI